MDFAHSGEMLTFVLDFDEIRGTSWFHGMLVKYQ